MWDGSSVRSAKTFDIIILLFFINRNENTVSSFAVVADIDITNVWQISMLLFRFVYIYIIILSKFAMKALTIVFLKLRNIFFYSIPNRIFGIHFKNNSFIKTTLFLYQYYSHNIRNLSSIKSIYVLLAFKKFEIHNIYTQCWYVWRGLIRFRLRLNLLLLSQQSIFSFYVHNYTAACYYII